jgi:hypothetical protein
MKKQECRWVMVGLYGCGWMQGHGDRGKQGKKSSKCVHMKCFSTHVIGKKKVKVNKDGNTPKTKQKKQ